jgi:P-type Ca2+ transporter type 2C
VLFTTILLQIAVIYVPFMKSFFGLVPLSAKDFFISMAAGSMVFLLILFDRKVLSGK